MMEVLERMMEVTERMVQVTERRDAYLGGRLVVDWGLSDE